MVDGGREGGEGSGWMDGARSLFSATMEISTPAAALGKGRGATRTEAEEEEEWWWLTVMAAVVLLGGGRWVVD